MASMDIDALLEAPFQRKDVQKDVPNGVPPQDATAQVAPALPPAGPAPPEAPKSDNRIRRSPSPRSRSPRRRSRSPRRRSRSPRRRSRSPRRRSRSPRRRSRSPRRSPRRRSRSPRRRSRSPRRRSRSPRRRSPSPRRRSPSPRRRSPSPRRPSPVVRQSPPRGGPPRRSPTPPVLTEEERDARTVQAMQLSKNCTGRDLKTFFEKNGLKVRDVRVIADKRGKRHTKGIAYVEFVEIESVHKAHLLGGQKLLGVPIIVMPTQSEKNRLAAVKANEAAGPRRINLSNLSPVITREQLMMVFEPFGKIRECQVTPDPDGSSPSTGFIHFDQPDSAQMAADQLNNFVLVDRPIKVALAGADTAANFLDRTASPGPANVIKVPAGPAPPPAVASANPRCVLLRHVFNPAEETEQDWHLDIQDELLEESSKHGPVLHIFVDPQSQGLVYIKFNLPEDASKALLSLNGRFFSGKQITAEYLQEPVYMLKFPDATNTEPLKAG
eukprot:m.104740 g.104740  ORF g.104740 m.104740 type:complete len:496 (+) comp8896_c0_seq3:31-1518(+)